MAIIDAGLGFGARPVRRPAFDRLGPNGRLILVPGGEAVLLEVLPNDQLAIFDPAGGQCVGITAFDKTGTSMPELLTFSGDAPQKSETTAPILNTRQRKTLKQCGADMRHASTRTAQRIDPGTVIEAEVNSSGLLVVAAPGGAGGVGEAGFPTDLEIHLQRPLCTNVLLIPEPLAEPIEEFIVDRCTARAYELSAGQFVQILDLEGRQCSDFQAFSRRALDAGSERFIDTTVTRSFTGSTYPGPGLFSRYFDQDVRPLIEVTHDTCGRHDTFGLACATRIYENKGFFTHANCSDNISDKMAPWGVEARAAWSAINLFFNTQVGAANIILGDEGWSQPGDYVLMRAADELVCVTTACPDDTSPINGWSPSDVLVRIYAADEDFTTKKGFRMSPSAVAATTRTTGFHPRTSKLTRHYRDAKDYWIPTAYSAGGVTEEYWATRDAVTIQDLSQIEKFDVTGPGAEALMNYALPRNVRRLAVGRATYSPMLRTHGGVFDDGVLFRLGPASFRWMCSTPDAGAWLRDLACEKDFEAHVREASRHLHNIAVQGPRSREALSSIVWSAKQQPKLDELKRFQFLVGRLGTREGPPIMVSRSGYTGELGYEVFCAPDDAPVIWDAIMAAGEPFGMKPMGLDALDILRIEAGLAAVGGEFDETVDPFEAGLGFTVTLAKKNEDFVGRAALERTQGAQRRALVGLNFETSELVAQADMVFSSEQVQAGTITSACFSPRTGTMLAMARVAIEYAEPGTVLEVGRLGGDLKRLRASVVALPLFRADAL